MGTALTFCGMFLGSDWLRMASTNTADPADTNTLVAAANAAANMLLQKHSDRRKIPSRIGGYMEP